MSARIDEYSFPPNCDPCGEQLSRSPFTGGISRRRDDNLKTSRNTVILQAFERNNHQNNTERRSGRVLSSDHTIESLLGGLVESNRHAQRSVREALSATRCGRTRIEEPRRYRSERLMKARSAVVAVAMIAESFHGVAAGTHYSLLWSDTHSHLVLPWCAFESCWWTEGHREIGLSNITVPLELVTALHRLISHSLLTKVKCRLDFALSRRFRRG